MHLHTFLLVTHWNQSSAQERVPSVQKPNWLLRRCTDISTDLWWLRSCQHHAHGFTDALTRRNSEATLRTD